MASGTISGATSNNYITGKLTFSSIQNIEKNNSSLTVTLIYNKRSVSGGSPTYGVFKGTLTVKSANGTATYGTLSINKSITLANGSGDVTVASMTCTVPHNSDGSMSVQIAISGGISGTSFSNGNVSGNAVLDIIPRASSISSITSSVEITGINTVTINIIRASTLFLHEIKFNIGSTVMHTTTGIETSYIYAIPMSWLRYIPNATSASVTVTVTTKNGSATVGTQTGSFTVTVPPSIVPTIGGFTDSKINNTVPAAWDVYVKTKSQSKLTIIGAAGAYGSKIKSYSITGGGFSGTSDTLTTGILNQTGNITFTAKVTDSRGRTAQASIFINVLDYAAPSASKPLSQRCLQSGEIDNDGTYVSASCTLTAAEINGHNEIVRTISYREVEGDEWVQAGEIDSNTIAVIGGDIDVNKTYEIRYTVSDCFASASIIDILSTSFTLFNFALGGKSWATGKASEREGFECALETWFLDDVHMSNHNLATISTSGDFTCYKWDDGSFIIFGKVLLSAYTGEVSQWGNSGLYRFFPSFTVPLKGLGISAFEDNTKIIITHSNESQSQMQLSGGSRIIDNDGTIEVVLVKASTNAEEIEINVNIQGREDNA